jgi:hypothetical protein
MSSGGVEPNSGAPLSARASRKEDQACVFTAACGSIRAIRHRKCTIESSSSARPASNSAQDIYE